MEMDLTHTENRCRGAFQNCIDLDTTWLNKEWTPKENRCIVEVTRQYRFSHKSREWLQETETCS